MCDILIKTANNQSVLVNVINENTVAELIYLKSYSTIH